MNKIENTKKEITESLLTLLNKKSYDDITIGDISKQCGLSRTTIYRHYEGKNEIISDFFQREIINSDLNSNLSFETQLRNRLIGIQKTNLHLYLSNSIELRKIFLNSGHEIFLKSLDDIDDQVRCFILGGIGITLKFWAEGGCKKDANVLCDELMALINKITKI